VIRRWLTVVWAGALAAALLGCGDANLFDGLSEDTSAARVEAAKIAIDDGRFSEAIAILEGLCGADTAAPTCDDETATLLAAAYAGRGGLNTFDLIPNVVNTNSGSAAGGFASFSTLFLAPTADQKNDMHVAVAILSNLSNPSSDQSLQLAIVAMTDIVITLGVDLTGGFQPNTGLPNNRPDLSTVQSAETADQTVTRTSEDLALVVQGVNGTGLVNEDVIDDINQVRSTMDVNHDGTVSPAEVQAFVFNL